MFKISELYNIQLLQQKSNCMHINPFSGEILYRGNIVYLQDEQLSDIFHHLQQQLFLLNGGA